MRVPRLTGSTRQRPCFPSGFVKLILHILSRRFRLRIFVTAKPMSIDIAIDTGVDEAHFLRFERGCDEAQFKQYKRIDFMAIAESEGL